MSASNRPPGKTTIAPEVLLTIVQLTVLKVPGVAGLSHTPGSVDRFFGLPRKRQPLQGNEGVHIEIKDDVVSVDLYLVLLGDYSVREVSHAVQHEVARAVAEMVGMQVGRVNVHIEDVEYPALAEA